MLLEYPESLQAVAWAMLLSLLGVTAWVKKAWNKKPWPRIELKTKRLVKNGFEVTDVALRIWGMNEPAIITRRRMSNSPFISH